MTTYATPIDESKAVLELSERRCWHLLGRTVVARLAITVDDLPHVFPVNYALATDGVVFRTDEQMTIDAATDGAVATLGVDNADHAFHTGWSVALTGVLHLITDPDERDRIRRLPLRAWGGDGEHCIRLRPFAVSGRWVAP